MNTCKWMGVGCGGCGGWGGGADYSRSWWSDHLSLGLSPQHSTHLNHLIQSPSRESPGFVQPGVFAFGCDWKEGETKTTLSNGGSEALGLD